MLLSSCSSSSSSLSFVVGNVGYLDQFCKQVVMVLLQLLDESMKVALVSQGCWRNQNLHWNLNPVATGPLDVGGNNERLGSMQLMNQVLHQTGLCSGLVAYELELQVVDMDKRKII